MSSLTEQTSTWLPEQLSRPRLLRESNHSDLVEIRGGLQFQLDVLCEALSFLELSDFRNLLYHRDVGQMPASVLSPQHLGIHMVKRNCQKKIRTVLVGRGIGVHVCPERVWGVFIERNPGNADRNLRRCGSLLEHCFNVLRIERSFNSFVPSTMIFWRVRCTLPQRVHIGILTLGQCMGRIRIPPSVVIPVIDVFAQNDQLRARNRL